MFTEKTRAVLQDTLIGGAREDDRIVAAALVGSGATGGQDRWSDIDLALRLGPGADRDTVVAAWTERMYGRHLAVDHLDVSRGDTLYRVFLRADTLQVDLSFWAHDRFRPTGSRFALLFGEALDDDFTEPAAATQLAGQAWLYALHARSSIARGRRWQAVHMIDGMRDQVIALACSRHDLPAVQGRGVDDLPQELTDSLTATLVGTCDTGALHDAFAATCAAFAGELAYVGQALAVKLAPVLRELVASARR